MSTFGTKKNISKTKQFVNAGDKGWRGGIVYYPRPTRARHWWELYLETFNFVKIRLKKLNS